MRRPPKRLVNGRMIFLPRLVKRIPLGRTHVNISSIIFFIILAIVADTTKASAQTQLPVFPLAPVGQGENGDWAYFSRYRSANATMAKAEGRIVFIGDSITERWAKSPTFEVNLSYVGRGISGQTTQQMVVRFKADVVRLKPIIVHIMGGTNDLAGNTGPENEDEIEDAILTMVEIAQANHIKVILASVPPAKDFGWRLGLRPAERIERLNRWIRSLASSRGCVYADYWSALNDGSGGLRHEFSDDGVHPNSNGFARMQPILQEAVRSANNLTWK